MKKYISYLSFINLCKSLVGYRAWNFAAINLFEIIDKAFCVYNTYSMCKDHWILYYDTWMIITIIIYYK